METTPEIKIPNPLVSILMLTYNRAHFIHEAITSVLNQTYKNWELIIIDDGSTDNTETIVNSFADVRIKYIKHPQNAGLFARRKESLAYATSKYTAILDSDDIWTDSKKLAEQVNFLEENLNHVVIGTMTTLIDANSKNIGQCTFATNDSSIRLKILIRNQFTHSSLLIRSEALIKTEGYLPTLAEDLEIILQLGKLGLLANLPSNYTAHRVHNNSENDHGIKMALAVRSIVKNHALNYPNAIIAQIFSYLRIIKGHLKNI